MGEIRDFLLSDYDFLEQMHDEQIDEIIISENKLELIFSTLHFSYDNNSKSARIVFSDLEDITSDVYVSIFVKKGEIIKGGCVKYIDDFFQYFKKENIKLEVTDILTGYDLIMIQGRIVNSDNSYREENFQMVISTNRITYCFYE